MNEENKPTAILTAREVSQYLRIPLATLYLLSKQGRIKAVKVGKHWRYVKADIDAFLNGENIPKRRFSGSRGTASFDRAQDKRRAPTSFVPDDQERRAYSRFYCYLPCEFHVITEDKMEFRGEAMLHNLSAGGALLVEHRKNGLGRGVDVGDSIRLRFTIQNGSESVSLEAEGKIVRFSKDGDVRVGVKLEGNGELEEKLAELLE